MVLKKRLLHTIFIVVLIAGIASLVYICRTQVNRGTSDELTVAVSDDTVSDNEVSDNTVSDSEEYGPIHETPGFPYYECGPNDFDINEVSDEIILGIKDVPSWGNQYELLGMTLDITANREAVCYVAGVEVGRKEIDEEAFNEFVAQIDYNEIATMEIYHPDPGFIMDGGSNYVVIHRKNNMPIERGGFCVRGEEFDKYYRLVLNLADYHWWKGCVDDYVEWVADIPKDKKESLMAAIPELVNVDELVEQLNKRQVSYTCNKIIGYGEPYIVDESTFMVYIVDEFGKKLCLEFSYDLEKKEIRYEAVYGALDAFELIDEPITCDMLRQLYEDKF